LSSVGGVLVGEDASHGEEDVDRASARVAEGRPAAGDAAEREPGGGDECMCVQDAGEDDVEEEALDSVLVCGQLAVVEVGGNDARVVRAVPGLRGRLIDECDPVVDRGGR
jgi:hypothetical protein